MVTFLFWNTNGKPLYEQIRELARAHQVDVIILGEFASNPVSLLEHLNSGPRPEFHFATGQCERIRIFTRFSSDFLRPTHESDRISIRRLRLPARLEILVVAAHLSSKLYQSEDRLEVEPDVVGLLKSVENADKFPKPPLTMRPVALTLLFPQLL